MNCLSCLQYLAMIAYSSVESKIRVDIPRFISCPVTNSKGKIQWIPKEIMFIVIKANIRLMGVWESLRMLLIWA